MDDIYFKVLDNVDTLGQILIIDDRRDLGRFSFPGHPSPLHHWQVGVAIRALAGLVRVAWELQGLLDAFSEPELLSYEVWPLEVLHPGGAT